MDIIEQTTPSSSIKTTNVAMPNAASAASISRTTKSAAVTKLLSRNKGATLGEIMAIAHWQSHSTRAFLTGLRKKGVKIMRETRSAPCSASAKLP